MKLARNTTLNIRPPAQPRFSRGLLGAAFGVFLCGFAAGFFGWLRVHERIWAQGVCWAQDGRLADVNAERIVCEDHGHAWVVFAAVQE